MKQLVAWLLVLCISQALPAQHLRKGTIRLLYTPGRPANQFIPSRTIGGAFDGHEKGDMDRMLNPQSVHAMQSVGLKPVAYRLRTELGGEVWHWNPRGTWSEEDRQQGYWVSDSVSDAPLQVSYGYRLPRRGNTIDQANDDGYSRIADGDSATFWKSNPYLDTLYTKESNDLHPQWVIVDLGALREVNTIRIQWGRPYAVDYGVEYALDIGSDYFDPFQPRLWHPFPQHVFTGGGGESRFIPLSSKPLQVRFVRISMTHSSYTTTGPSKDIRDQLGFAIRELSVGLRDGKGGFHDWVRHAPDHNGQSTVYVSSTDPWHRAQDLDPGIEQAGLDRFFASGLTGGQPVMMPAGLLYDTPENVVAMVRYLDAKHYPFGELEMGEEPEGQLISPVDYAALYLQFGARVRDVKPSLRMGGPGFATLSFTPDDTESFPESAWTKLFLDYLRAHDAINLFHFFTFEWYPFDDVCAPTAPQLAVAPQMLTTAMDNLRHAGLPEHTPVYLSEYAYSAFGGKAGVEIEGALVYADILGTFLQLGGGKSFLYGYEPAYLEQTEGCGYGNNLLFGLGKDGTIRYRTAAYYGVHMLTHHWAQPPDSLLEVYPATTSIVNKANLPLVTAYALRAKDGRWSVMLINKDPGRSWQVGVEILNTVSKSVLPFRPKQLVQYSGQQYRWLNKGLDGHPARSLPPLRKSLPGPATVTLPRYSLTILQ